MVGWGIPGSGSSPGLVSLQSIILQNSQCGLREEGRASSSLLGGHKAEALGPFTSFGTGRESGGCREGEPQALG